MAILFRFDAVSGYRRVLDVKGGFSDSGLYVRNGALSFYPRATGAGTPVNVDQYVQVVLTRDGAGTVTGYVNGTKQFEFADEANEATISNDLFTGIRLIWFVDNKNGGAAALRR